MADDRICVSARVRPLSFQEAECRDEAVLGVQDGVSIVHNSSSRGEATAFTFDAAFGSPSGVEPSDLQRVVYEQVGRPVLQNALQGINGCLFAFGQTGSGKTFSLFGTPEAPGVVPQLAAELLEAKRLTEEDGDELNIKAAFLELYNENLVDLQTDSREALKLFENSQEGVVVPDLSETVISTGDEFGMLLDLATQNRSVGATCMNVQSSRSHALIQLRLELKNSECTKRAKIFLIDLAGSERQKRAQNEGSRLKEGIHINVSLSALGLVISRLSEIAQGRNHCSVPFRDSKLTFLLKDSLSGNARTQVLIALSPAASNYEESLSALRFAQSVKKIRTRAVANIVKVGANSADVAALQSEVERLRAELDAMRTAIAGSTGCFYSGGAESGSGVVPADFSNLECRSVGDHTSKIGQIGENDSAAAAAPQPPKCQAYNQPSIIGPEDFCCLEGTYRSPQGTQIDVNREGCVRFVGTEHHPIRILRSSSSDESLDYNGSSRCICVLQADQDPEYRYVLAYEHEQGIVWRHEPFRSDVDSFADTGIEICWDKVPNKHPSGTGGTATPPPSNLMRVASCNESLLDLNVIQALETLQYMSSDSRTLSRVSAAVPSLVRALSPAAAVDAVEALISLCAELDVANYLLDQGADIGMLSSSSGLEAPSLEATWLAPEVNQEMSARELLRVKIVWRTCPIFAQVWSVLEFARWLESVHAPDISGLAEAPDSATPKKASTSMKRRLSSSSPISARSPALAFGRPYSSQVDLRASRSPSPSLVPRPSPSPTPMPRGLESTRSLPGALHNPLTLHRCATPSRNSPSPVRYSGRALGLQTRPATPSHDRRPQSADPCRDGRLTARERNCRRSPTTPPMSSEQMGSRKRSSSAAMVRSRLGVAAGPGDPNVVAKAFDKNSMRLRNGRIFVNALTAWKARAHRPSAPTRRLQPGMCAVFVRKRPMFERDRNRCDYDVLSVIRKEHDTEDSPVGPEIVHHACMFDKSMVTPFVCHTLFPFDSVFDDSATNETVYRDVGQPLLENVLGGHVATLFVFGQTGSGKTYTMRAIEHMAAQELFERLDMGTKVSVTYFELAGRKALDLLTDQKSEIRLREEEDGCFRPHDCEEAVVTNAEDLLQVMASAAARRATEATTVNDTSSRSHSVCRITILRKGQAAGRLLLVDCAGTEGSRDTLFFKGQHVKQSAEINSSLFALKDCIRFRQAAIHKRGATQEGLPLRLPSVRATLLTKVLAESLISASAQLAAIATVSPNATDSEHTIDTLRTVYTLSGRGEARVLEERQVLE